MSHKRIFVSQSELNLGRDRAHRKLERELDNPNQENRFRTPLLTNLDTGEVSRSSCQLPLFHTSSPVYCSYYNSRCPPNIKKYSMRCIFGTEQCKIKKFYDKYYLDEEEKFIGSRI